MNKLFDLVRVTTASTGTGATITLGAAVAGGFLTFGQGGVADGDTVTYAIDDAAGGKEIGPGVYNSAGTTLTRGTPYKSSGAGFNTRISLSGNAQVTITAAAEDFGLITLGSTGFRLGDTVASISGLTLSGATLASTTNFPGGQGSGITTGGNLYLGGTNKLLFGNITGDAPITHSNTLLPSLIGSGAAVTDAKTLFYELSSTNWAGEGVDNSGNYWRRTGLSGGGNYVAQYANGGVYIGPSPTSPGAGNLLVNGNVLAAAGSISIGSNIVGSSTSAAYTIGADPNAVGGGYIQVYGSASSNTVVIGVGATHKARLYASGGFYVGDAPADPGTGNLLVSGTGTFSAASGTVVTLGTSSTSSTATPVVLNMGGTFSSSAGANPKLQVFNNGSAIYGLGVSSGQLDYMAPSGAVHHFYSGGADGPMSASSGTFSGIVYSSGSAAGLQFQDRGGSTPVWTWFSSSSLARLYNGIDVLTVDTSGNLTATATIKTGVYTVAGLPTAGTAGRQAAVNNATMTLTLGIGTIVAGGGANTVPVFDDGTNWRIG